MASPLTSWAGIDDVGMVVRCFLFLVLIDFLERKLWEACGAAPLHPYRTTLGFVRAVLLGVLRVLWQGLWGFGIWATNARTSGTWTVFDAGSDLELPDDVVRKVLLNLSLVDLAKMATTCHFFQHVYLEAHRAEKAWLDSLTAASESMFGPHVVDALCEWLFSQYRQNVRSHNDYGGGHSEIDITDGATRSQPSGQLSLPWWQSFELKAPGCGLREDGQKSEVLWTGDIIGDKMMVRRVVFNSGRDKIIFALIYDHEGNSQLYVFNCPTAIMPTFVGFLHRILDAEAVPPAGQAVRRQAKRRDLNLCLPSSVSSTAEEARDVQRALSALVMCHWSRWNIRVTS